MPAPNWKKPRKAVCNLLAYGVTVFICAVSVQGHMGGQAAEVDHWPGCTFPRALKEHTMSA